MTLKDMLLTTFFSLVTVFLLTYTARDYYFNSARFQAGDCVMAKGEETWMRDACLHIMQVGNKNYLATTCENYNAEVNAHAIVTQMFNLPFNVLNRVGNKVECPE